jgi:hypothetical protein
MQAFGPVVPQIVRRAGGERRGGENRKATRDRQEGGEGTTLIHGHVHGGKRERQHIVTTLFDVR